MKVKVERVIEDCLNSGINLGWNKAHKHLDDPSEGLIKDAIHDCIMEQIYEYFSFDEEF
jgi:hypothetical protein